MPAYVQYLLANLKLTSDFPLSICACTHTHIARYSSFASLPLVAEEESCMVNFQNCWRAMRWYCKVQWWIMRLSL